jgi:glycerol-3-phosphate acyltransferase PlsY
MLRPGSARDLGSRIAAVDLTDVAAVLGGYLIGSIDFGVIVPRVAGVDIYDVGSGNPGATNVLRTLGRGAAAAVLLGDLLKGFVAAMIGGLVGGEVVGFAAGFAAVVGHCFPLWYRFKGGKGVAAAGGMVFWLEPLLGLALLAVWAALVGLTRKASIASVVLAILFVPGLVLFGHRSWSLAWAGGAALLILVRHQGNIRRLLSGAEHTIEGTAS